MPSFSYKGFGSSIINKVGVLKHILSGEVHKVPEDVMRSRVNNIAAAACAEAAMASVAPVAAGMSVTIVGISEAALLTAGAGALGAGMCYIASDSLIKQGEMMVKPLTDGVAYIAGNISDATLSYLKPDPKLSFPSTAQAEFAKNLYKK